MQKSIFFKHTWIVLLLNILFCVLPCLQISAQNVNEMNVTLNMKRASLKQFLDEIGKQTSLEFVYDAEQIDKINDVTINAQDKPVRSVLGQVLGQVSCSYSISGNVVTITQKSEPNRSKGISGQITDAQGIPLPGVTIRMEGFNGGYITDIDGRYSIETTQKEAKLSFTYIGYKTLHKTVKNGTAGNFVLEEDAEMLGEVVVTGYGTKNKNSFTGAQTSIKRDQLISVGTKSILESLSAFVPGMMVLENNTAGSDPNKLADINIRGRATFDGTANMPVFVVDGSQVNVQYVYDMDVNDIESVTVLKDASASALYGAKASAGVIVIKTKAMTGGRLKLNYNGTVRLSTPDLSDYNLLGAAEKLEYERLAGLYSSTNPQEQYALEQQYADIYRKVKDGVYTNWIAKPLRNAISHQHSLSIDGGDERARYSLGVRYGNDAGVMKGSNRERLSTNFRLSYGIDGKFFISNTSTLSSIKTNNSPYGDFSYWVKQNPYENPYDENGEYRQLLHYNLANPLYQASLGSYSKSDNLDFLNTTSLQVWINKVFRIDGDFSIQTSKLNSRNFTSPFSALEIKNKADVSRRGTLRDGNSKTANYQGKIMLSYNAYVLPKLFLTAMGGSSIESSTVDGADYTTIGFYTDKLGHPSFATSYANNKPSGTDIRYNGVGFFVNANTIYDNRYFLDLIYRYEGSSKFGKNSRFAPFWSIGTGWNIHNEKFMKGSPFQLLKLRASMGYLGNISFEPYQALTTYTYANGYNYVKGIGAVPLTIGNTNLKWERTLSNNIGLDITMFKGRFDFSADYYIKNTDNLLLDITKAPSIGVATSRENVGEVQNTGFELQARVLPIKTKDWQWSVGVNYSYNKNKIKKISNALKAQNEKNQKQGGVTPLPIYEEGQSLTALKVVPSAGIDPSTGNEIYIKRDGSYTMTYDPNDKVIFGDTTPFGIGAMTSYLTYKSLSFGASFRYSFGGAVYNQTLASKVEGADPRYNADARVFNSRWKQTGDNAKYKRIDDTSVPMQTSRFVEVNNFLTLSSISLGYDVPTTVSKRLGLNRLRFELIANDLFYWSTVKRERGLSYPYDRSIELSVRLSL